MREEESLRVLFLLESELNKTGMREISFVFVRQSGGPEITARRAELRRKLREAARVRARQASASSQNEAEESVARRQTEEEATKRQERERREWDHREVARSLDRGRRLH